MLDRYHSKYHRYNHHTDTTPGYVDSATDPIASPADPFKGNFHVLGQLSATSVYTRSSMFFGTAPNRGQISPSTFSAPQTYTLPNNTGTFILDSTITSYISAISGGAANSFISSNTVWVDSISGSDLTGIRDRADRPFKTLTGAQSVAVSGDLVFVRNGNYTDTNIGKNGVNWYFDVGSRITISNPTAPIFTYSSASYNVYGNLAISISGSVSPTANIGLVADFTGSSGSTDLLFEFKSINITNSASFAVNPTTGVFKGSFGAKNIIIRGDVIKTEKISVFSGVKTLTSGVQYIKLDVAAVIGQNIFNDSLHRLSSYINTNILSASDYIFNDYGTNDSLDYLNIKADNLYGSIVKDNTTGPISINTANFVINPRSGSIWSSTAGGDIIIYADKVHSNIKMDVGPSSFFRLNHFTINDVNAEEYAIGYTSQLTFVSQDVVLSAPSLSSTNYSLFIAHSGDSVLRANIDNTLNTTANKYIFTNTNDVSGAKVFVNVNRLPTGGDINLHGTNTKAKLLVGSASSVQVDIKVGSSSTDSIFYIDGELKSTVGNNLTIEAASGHASTKLYLKGGSVLEAVSGFNIDASQVIGNPVDIYILGVVGTNLTPIDTGDNFVINCGMFETTSAIEVPLF